MYLMWLCSTTATTTNYCMCCAILNFQISLSLSLYLSFSLSICRRRPLLLRRFSAHTSYTLVHRISQYTMKYESVLFSLGYLTENRNRRADQFNSMDPQSAPNIFANSAEFNYFETFGFEWFVIQFMNSKISRSQQFFIEYWSCCSDWKRINTGPTGVSVILSVVTQCSTRLCYCYCLYLQYSLLSRKYLNMGNIFKKLHGRA